MPLVTSPLGQAVIGAAIRVHRALGPGLLESVYQPILACELNRRGIAFETEVPLPIIYEGIRVECGYRLDFVVDHQMILELKSVEALLPVHSSQVLTCLRVSGFRQALLINFNVSVLKDGLKSFLWTPPGETAPLRWRRQESEARIARS